MIDSSPPAYRAGTASKHHSPAGGHAGEPNPASATGCPGSSGDLPSYCPPQEPLPAYKPSLEYYGLALLKTEFSTPYHCNNHDRSWRPVLLEINSTQLNMYALRDKKVSELIVCLYGHLNSLSELINEVNVDHPRSDDTSSRSSINLDIGGDAYGSELAPRDPLVSGFSKLRMKHKKFRAARTLQDLGKYHQVLRDNQYLFEPTASPQIFRDLKARHAGDLVQSFTLSNLQVGEAPSLHQLISAMYKEEKDCGNAATLVRYKNVLRMRIEYKQVLLQFWSFHGMVHWFRALTVGRDLSHPLEARVVSRLKSIPSRASSRNNALLVATAAEASYRDDSGAAVAAAPVARTQWRDSSDSKPATPSSASICSSSGASSPESVFDSTSTATAQTDPDPAILTTNINGFPFVSHDALHTPVEKQYISNCIPDLNSYDKWSGRSVTLSHYHHFVDHPKGSAAAPSAADDIFIGYPVLLGNSSAYEKAQAAGAAGAARGGVCRTFLIHTGGLVSVGAS